MHKDSVLGTIVVAAVLCVCCSILVAGSAVMLKPLQTANKAFDIKRNMLLASGLIDATANKEQILEIYKKINPVVIDLAAGQVVENPPEGYEQRKAAKDPKQRITIDKTNDIAGIKYRAKMAQIYEVRENNQLAMYILPVHGKGLWSTLYGFLAMSPDFQTIKGLGFYEHAETPGLGGEVDNPTWKAQWVGKRAFDDQLQPIITVLKGAVPATDAGKDHKVDGLSGATITSNGVTNLAKYWLGDDGYGPFIKNTLSMRGQNEQN